MSKTEILSLVALLAFSALMIGVGIYSKKRANNVNGFLLGERSIGPWLSACAYGTSYLSAVIFIGYAGQNGWEVGIGSIWIGVFNALIASLLAWVVLAKPTHSMTRRLEAKTMPELLHKRFDSKGMKFYSACIIFVFLVPYAAGVYKGLGSLFSSIFEGADPLICMILVAVLTAVYLVLGGYFATAINDFIQAIIIVVGVFVMLFAFYGQPEVGGVSGWLDSLKEASINLHGDERLVDPIGGDAFKTLLLNILLTSFGVFGLPQMIHKFYAIKDERSIKPATVISTAFCVISGVGAYIVGTFGPILLGGQLPGDYDSVVPTMLIRVFGSGDVFLALMLGIILLLLLSASMSTLSSVVLTAASSISVDLVSLRKKPITEKKQMLLTRGLCIAFIALSVVFASANVSYIVNLMSFSWGVVAGTFIGPYVWGLFTKRVTKAAAWVGTVSGLAVVVIGVLWFTLTSGDGFAAAKANAPLLGVLAMLVSFVSVPLVSLFTKKFSDDHNKAVFGK